MRANKAAKEGAPFIHGVMPTHKACFSWNKKLHMSPRRPRSTLGLTTQCLSNSKIKINNNNNKTSTFYSLETKTFLLLFANSILLFQTQNLGLVYLFRLFMPLFPKLPPLSSYPLTQSFVFFFQQYHNYHCYKLKYILTTQTKKCS